MDSFFEAKKLLESRFEPFWDEISDHVDVPDFIIPIQYDFKDGPSLTLEIPSVVVKLFYRDSDALFNITLEGYERTENDTLGLGRTVIHRNDKTIISIFKGEKHHSVNFTSEVFVGGVEYILDLCLPNKNLIFGKAQRYPGTIEKWETFTRGKFRIYDFTNALRGDVHAERGPIEFIALFDASEDFVVESPELLKPLMDVIEYLH